MYAWLALIAAGATVAVASPTFFSRQDVVVDPDASPAIEAPSPCGDLIRLEPDAMLGQLRDDAIACLDGLVADSEADPARRDGASRLLLVHLWAAGDKEAWEAQAVTHVETIDDGRKPRG